MGADRGSPGPERTGVLARPGRPKPHSKKRYQELGREALLDAILGETAAEAAAEEAAIIESFTRREREEAARREAEEAAKRESLAASVIEERERLRRARQLRRQVAREIEEEELRRSGLWSRVEAAERAAPDTEELAAVAKAAAVARENIYQPSELIAARPRRTHLMIGGAAAGVLVLTIGLASALTGGVDLDPISYERSRVSVVVQPNPAREVAVRETAAEQRHRTPQRTARSATRPRSTASSPAATDLRADSGAAAAEPLDISLDNAADLWRVGSE